MNEANSIIDGAQAFLQSIEDTWNKFSGMVADVTNIEGFISSLIAGAIAALVVGGISYLIYNLFQG
jgi:hypothetical protein